MVTIGLDEARADMAGLLDRVEKGEDVLITRRTDPTPTPAEAVTMREILEDLARFRDSQPPWPVASADLLREMRDEGY